MSFIAKGNNDEFDRKLPTTGWHMAVCVDVVDMGEQPSTYSGTTTMKPKCNVVFELDEKHPDFDGPHRVYQRCTVSLAKNAHLRKLLNNWRGKDLTDTELEGFDLEKLVGVSAFINIIHSDDDKWANIGSIGPAPDGKKLKPSGGYERKETDANGAPPMTEAEASAKGAALDPFIVPDDLPF